MAWSEHDRDCPRRYPQTDEFRCTCGVDLEKRNALLRLQLENYQLESRLKARS